MVGRLVKTHSTYLEGLIPWLKSLCEVTGMQTLTPGVLSRTQGKVEKLEIRVSTQIKGGYKLIARKGKSLQEVFIICKLDRKTLINQIRITRPKRS